MRVGISVGHEALIDPDASRRRATLARIRDVGLDHITVGDHVSFHGGIGFDGIVTATAILASQSELPVILGVYMLGLRHPMLAARQIATMSEMAPGRFTLGVGVGGEDRSEISNSGVDPATRGRRLDETLDVLRDLWTGEPVTRHGEFFDVVDARVLPAPTPTPPVVVGGRGEAAIKRTVQRGDGWLGIFCTPRRFEETRTEILTRAKEVERPAPGWFGVNVWCGLAADASTARQRVGSRMQSLYQLPPEKFEHLVPAGPPEQVAAWVADMVKAGAEHVTLVPVAGSVEEAIDHTGAVAAILRDQLP